LFAVPANDTADGAALAETETEFEFLLGVYVTHLQDDNFEYIPAGVRQ
jgi:hypothetical protein